MTPTDRLWLRLACESAPGKPRVSVADPWVRAVTEKRSTTHGYSGCGDLGHFWLTRLGYRRTWLNRAELPQGWAPGVNVSRICARPFGSCPEATNIHRDDEPPVPGDVLTVAADDPRKTHVMVVLSWSLAETIVAEYGQPGGAVHPKTIHAQGDRWVLGSRVLHSCLRVAELGEPETEADFAMWAATHELLVPEWMLDNPAEKAGELP